MSNQLYKPLVIVGLSSAILSSLVTIGVNQVIQNTSSSSSGITIQQTKSTGSSIKVKDYSDVVDKTANSVVEIVTESRSNGNSPFSQYVAEGAGSGVIMSEDGYIITNQHVVDGASSIKVTLRNGKSYDAKLIGEDEESDLAVLKIEASGLTPATFGDSSTLQVGDAAIAIGNPLGELGGTVTTGIISATDRQIEIQNKTMTLLQTDAAINAGNSGGGLFDANGNLIGIVDAKVSSEGVEGLGFAIPISNALDTINELIENGKVTNRPALNVSLYTVAEQNSQGQEPGVYIVQIVKGGAAEKAGLEVDDQIIEVDGTKVETTAQVKAVLNKHKVGDQVKVVVQRDGQKKTINVTLGTLNQ